MAKPLSSAVFYIYIMVLYINRRRSSFLLHFPNYFPRRNLDTVLYCIILYLVHYGMLLKGQMDQYGSVYPFGCHFLPMGLLGVLYYCILTSRIERSSGTILVPCYSTNNSNASIRHYYLKDCKLL